MVHARADNFDPLSFVRRSSVVQQQSAGRLNFGRSAMVAGASQCERFMAWLKTRMLSVLRNATIIRMAITVLEL